MPFLRGETVGVPVTEEERKKNRNRTSVPIPCNNKKNREKFWGVRGTLSRVPRRIPVPAGYLLRRFSQCRFRLSPGNARGEAPCIRKLKIPPFPPGRGSGGWGQKSKPKAGLAGDKEGTPLAGQRQGKVSQRGGGLFQESPGASLSPPGATAVLPQKRRRRSASDRGSPTAHRSAQCGGKSWR